MTSRLFKGTRGSLAVIALISADTLALMGALVCALILRYDSFSPVRILSETTPHLQSLPFVLGAYLLLFAAFRLYRYAWRFASLEMLWSVIFANSLGLLSMVILQRVIDHRTLAPSTLVIFWLLSIVVVGGFRILLRLINVSRLHGSRAMQVLRRDVRPKRVVILGGGSDGARLLASLHEDIQEPYDVIGFLDDLPQRKGIYIRGVRVLGPLSHLHKLLDENAVDEVFIAIPEASGERIREYVMACRQRHIDIKIIPGIQDVVNRKSRARLEDISVEDLLRRPTVQINLSEIDGYITGKRVMVTGAGGSIGSELCRQIIARNPSMLILLGHGENSIHQISQELRGRYPHLADRLHVVIGSVADNIRMEQAFRSHRPELVFHAAAHKHVPIMEVNVPEAVQNNVLGTHCIADCCGRYDVESMVLISTDKAVYPSSVMGATKWLCEQVVRATAEHYPHVSYVTVRFGNVLGSRGSVVPIFQEQIKRGGPITITHPEMTRFFMIIPEAVQLVLQAATMGRSGDLFLLDMGKPVKIVDLARDLIRLSGLQPDKDIAIAFIGLRPGERLHEVLTTEDEELMPAPCDGMSIVHQPAYFTASQLQFTLKRLRELAERGDGQRLHEMLMGFVPLPAHKLSLEMEAAPATDTVSILTQP